MVSNNWQQTFIERNVTVLGYNAWLGYLTSGRGLLVCSTDSPKLTSTGATFEVSFIARRRLAPFLNAWLTAPDTVLLQNHFNSVPILEAVDRYDPETDVMLLLQAEGRATFFCLEPLPVTPPQCYRKIRDRRSEFEFDTESP
ncbi:hypothetical protein POG22_04860 [Geitlerinema sp. CS-897]|nr:hypothetical protein [Geitlerinema sp. CS-897]